MATVVERAVTPEDLSNEPVEVRKVKVDDKGGVMFIGSLTADEFAEWNDAKKNSDSVDMRRNASARLIMQSLVRSLTDSTRIGTEEMIPMFRKARVARTERLLKAILKLNGINEQEEADVKND